MRDLFIVGAGGFGREAVWTVERINAASQQPLWNVIGFADDDPQKAEGNFEGYPMLGSVEKASRDNPGASVFIAIGDNAIRRKIYGRLRGHDFPALIDPSAQVSPTTEFRHGTFTSILGNAKVNIDAIANKSRGDFAYTLIDTDSAIPADVVKALEASAAVIRVRVIK